MKKGMEKGMEEGLEQGIEQEKIEAVKAFLDVFDDEEIARRLNFDINFVKKIREEVELTK
ncbi:MAG: hypothetical protein ACRCWG_11770 [Sarcina sp.]